MPSNKALCRAGSAAIPPSSPCVLAFSYGRTDTQANGCLPPVLVAGTVTFLPACVHMCVGVCVYIAHGCRGLERLVGVACVCGNSAHAWSMHWRIGR